MNEPKTLGPSDEPRGSGVVVAVHYGDYRHVELWISSGSSVGNWYCLGNEFGVPRHGSNGLPLHPHWEDILARGPVTLLSAGSQEAYEVGWANGRRRMIEQMEAVSDVD